MVAAVAALVVAILTAGAEWLHARRVARIARLAFGPAERPRLWARTAPFLRVGAAAAVCWGLVTLTLLPPKTHRSAETIEVGEYRHLLVVLDVSPSMRLEDSGPTKKQSRMHRARDVMESYFRRVPLREYRISVLAVYNGAKPVVIDTTDVEVVRNIFNDLPMHYAFRAGKTDLFAGLEEAVEVARPWKPRSATLVLVSDGDTVPAQGMPRLPASIADVLVVGIGDPVQGRFIDGRQSRQDSSTLRQLAVRLHGTYHNGNEHHLSSELLRRLDDATRPEPLSRLTIREYAMLSSALGASLLACVPLLLHLAGSSWRPGRNRPPI